MHFLYAGTLDNRDYVILDLCNTKSFGVGGSRCDSASSSVLTWQVRQKEIGDSFLSTCPERWDEQEKSRISQLSLGWVHL